jgi:hypothetical protein
MKKFMLLIFCFGWLALSATSWRVNNNPAIDADFATFQEAVAGASEGDTLYVEGSQFSYGDQYLTKRLVVIGPGYFLTENDSTQVSNLEAKFEEFAIDTLASGSKIYGLWFWDGDVVINGSDVVFARNKIPYYHDHIMLAQNNSVINCVITQNYCSAIASSTTYFNPVNVLISNNYIDSWISFHGNSSCVIFNNLIGIKCVVYNSIIKNNIHYGSSSSGDGFNENTNNVFEYNMTTKSTIIPGVGNVSDIVPEDIFVDYDGSLDYSTDGKWQLKEGSAAIGAGENGVDCGMFGGTSPYVLSGMPAVPHIYEAIVPTSGSAASGLPVTIKVKSQN